MERSVRRLALWVVLLGGPVVVLVITGSHPSSTIGDAVHFFAAVMLTLASPFLVAFLALETVDLARRRSSK